MIKKTKIAWDISHLEFTIEDHYYFSHLKSKVEDAGAVVEEVDSFKRVADYDVIVLNYPEKPFTKSEVKLLRDCFKNGKKIIVAGYYNNEDKIADRINSLSYHFGLSLNGDSVRDKMSNEKGDDLLVVSSRVLSYNTRVNKVFFPCTASITVHESSANPIVLLENKGGATPPLRSPEETIIGAEVQSGEGKFILLGTCVFWDNFAIRKCSNLRFSLNLLLG